MAAPSEHSRSGTGTGPGPTRFGPLPTELTRFVGRAREVAEVDRLLADSRVLTLTGAGGSGKSRLGLEVARGLATRGPVGWVEIGSAPAAGALAERIAAALGITEDIGSAAELPGLLPDEPFTLVLDGCEPFVQACAELVADSLRARPGLHVLATSREPLGIHGERAWLVPPMAWAGATDAEEPPEAVSFFEERARDFAPDFRVTPANAEPVREICERLGGIPLAIELAAARVKVLTPEQIRARLDDMFGLLTTGARTHVPRHRTLRAAMDWSHDLLPEGARTLLRRLAVFRGGFQLEAVEAVAADADLPPEDVLDLLAQLVDRSLVTVRERGGRSRYELLEPVRQYAAGRLVESGEEDALRRRHAQHCLASIEDAEPHLRTPARRGWLDRLDADLDNIRAALRWSRAEAPDLFASLVAAMWCPWFSSRHWGEARRCLDDALSLPETVASERVWAALVFASGALDALQANAVRGRARLQEAVRRAEALDPRLLAYARTYLGMAYAQEADPSGIEPLRLAHAWFVQDGDPYGLHLCLLLLGALEGARGELAEAARLSEEAVAVARELGEDRELGIALQSLGVSCLHTGERERSRQLLLESLAALQRAPTPMYSARAIHYLGVLETEGGDPVRGGFLTGVAESMRAALRATPFLVDRRILECALERLGDSGAGTAHDDARARGRAADPEQVIGELLAQSPVAAEAPPAPEPTSTATRAVPDADITLRTLGPLEIDLAGERVDPEVWHFSKPRELLVLLSLHPLGRTRDEIASAIWPDASPSQLKNSFHVTLHHLRKTLGDPAWVRYEDERYRLRPDLRVRVDLLDFEVRVRRSLEGAKPTPEAERELRDVLAAYRGPFLEDQIVGPWAQEHADRARRLHREATLELGALLDGAGRQAESVALYRTLVVSDELDEEAHRRLMAALSSAGRADEALAVFADLRSLLERELDATPEQATVRLRDDIAASAAPLIAG